VLTGCARRTQSHQKLAIVTQLEYLVQPYVGEPEIIVTIDPEAMGHDELILGERSNLLASCTIKTENGRLGNQREIGFRRVLATSAMKDEDLIVAIDGHT
ncbi:MAG: hypothetical protein WA607_10080, partial [Candidatus Sulfotelmatobacter sp.]